MGDHDHLRHQFVFGGGLGQQLLRAQQDFQYALGHLLDVGLAFAQVWVFDFIELRR